MKKKILITVIVLLCIVALIIFLCVKNASRNDKQSQENSNFKIVTSFYPIYIMTLNVTEGANKIELKNMAELNGGCLHDYTLSTTDVKKVENANVFIENGVGIENFTEKLLQIYSRVKIIDSSREIQDIISSGEEQNGHIWTSLDNYKKQVENIAYELSNYNSENADIYNKNANEYIAKIEDLENRYKEELSNLSGEKAICLNEAFEYLGRDLNLDMIMVETDHEESTLSADRLRSLIDQAKASNIKAIIIGEDDNTQNAETIATETGAKIYKLKTGMSGDYSKNSYLDDMEYNLEQLKDFEN